MEDEFEQSIKKFSRIKYFGIAISPLAIFNLIYFIQFYLMHNQIDDMEAIEGSCFYDKNTESIASISIEYDGSKEILSYLRKKEYIIDIRGSYSSLIT
jgi:hypothetical protein